MATVRQLTTRFQFQTDRRGIDDFKKNLSGMTKAIAAVAAAIGTGFVVKMAAMGSALNDAAVRASFFTDDFVRMADGTVKVVGEMADVWERVQEAIPGRVQLDDFINAFATFKQLFKEGTLEDFESLFEAAGLIAKITGEDVFDSFKRLSDAAASGEFRPIREIFPNFDVLDEAAQRFIQSLVKVDPTNVNNVMLDFEAILRLAREAPAILRPVAKEMVETTSTGQWRELKENIEATAKVMRAQLEPSITAALKATNGLFKEWVKGEGIVGSVIDFIKRSIAGLISFVRDPGGVFENLVTGLRSAGKKLLDFVSPAAPALEFVRREAGPFARLLNPRPGMPAIGAPGLAPVTTGTGGQILEQIINVSPQFIINGATDAIEVGRQVVEQLNLLLDQAVRGFPPLEHPLEND